MTNSHLASTGPGIEVAKYRDLLTRGDLRVPDGFLLGASTAAYQIEGGANAGGRGPSIWDTFSHTPGKTADGATGDVAADHFHRMNEDLDLMAALGLGAYRFSISWSRVMPLGEGDMNPEGMQFYSSLVDGLLARGITPVVTLNHWDLPQHLEDIYGGWRGRETAYAFERYAEEMGSLLGDRVWMWSTHNEPWNNSYSGYGSGAFAPGVANHEDALKAVHHLNLAHGLGVAALRRTVTHPDLNVSIVLNIFRIEGVTPSDDEAVRLVDAVANRAFTGPVLRGSYPDDLIEDTRKITDWAFVLPGDMAICHQRLDSLGINYYEVMHVRSNEAYLPGSDFLGGTDFPGSERISVVRKDDIGRTAMDWGVEPRGLEDHLLAVSAEFPELPIIVMENGAAFTDEVTELNGSSAVVDRQRTQYLIDHLTATLSAKGRGANVVGYFVWSLLDNFEWALGYGPRFGIIRVDYDTLARTPKLSAAWLAEVNATRLVSQLRNSPTQRTD
ncbi:GH1 family beta-glucosidase [Microbacterium oleivorans]|uniref:Beta-glucosidase n=1 Tax=Microbacterium oleivorans TaxID=273677 RepID=A0A4V6PNI4_9MICO|nr:GH1 family beta-glucosidase [Microbacterium oleivorans]TDL45253.1 beta-glucosidase [Microbacterium oleivorans]